MASQHALDHSGFKAVTGPLRQHSQRHHQIGAMHNTAQLLLVHTLPLQPFHEQNKPTSTNLCSSSDPPGRAYERPHSALQLPHPHCCTKQQPLCASAADQGHRVAQLAAVCSS